VLDRHTLGVSPARRRRLSELFTLGTRLELAFWEMAYAGLGREER
jgi:thiaminase